MSGRKIYLASSWRNPEQPQILATLRAAGHEVYDFRNPTPERGPMLSRDWANCPMREFAAELNTPDCVEAFGYDKRALDWCDTCVLALPCNRSAHLDLGYCAGAGKQSFVLLRETGFEPELMYLLCDGVVSSLPDLVDVLALVRAPPLGHAPLVFDEGGGP